MASWKAWCHFHVDLNELMKMFSDYLFPQCVVDDRQPLVQLFVWFPCTAHDDKYYGSLMISIMGRYLIIGTFE